MSRRSENVRKTTSKRSENDQDEDKDHYFVDKKMLKQILKKSFVQLFVLATEVEGQSNQEDYRHAREHAEELREDSFATR